MAPKRTRRKKRGGGVLSVKFPIRPNSAGIYSKRNFQGSEKPAIRWPAPQKNFYTLVCYDPDAPESAWLHWLCVNCGGTDPSTGADLVPWEPPTPPSGTHRYYFALFQQADAITIEAPPRPNFSIENFIRVNRLKRIDQIEIRVRS